MAYQTTRLAATRWFLAAMVFFSSVVVGLAQTNVSVCLTNNSLFNGELVSQTDSNLIISVGGNLKTFQTHEIRWQELKIKQREPKPSLPSPPLEVSAPAGTPAASARPMTEAELRAQLKSPEGQKLLIEIHDRVIGTETDPRAKKASEYYFKTMQAFADGQIGLAEIQGQSQQMLGELGKYQKEMAADPQRERWTQYKNILEQFGQQPVQ